jgi:hypothetical protein
MFRSEEAILREKFHIFFNIKCGRTCAYIINAGPIQSTLNFANMRTKHFRKLYAFVYILFFFVANLASTVPLIKKINVHLI